MFINAVDENFSFFRTSVFRRTLRMGQRESVRIGTSEQPRLTADVESSLPISSGGTCVQLSDLSLRQKTLLFPARRSRPSG